MLNYPFNRLENLNPKNPTQDLAFIQSEAIAQLAAVFYTKPELTKQVMPQGYAFMEAIKNDLATEGQRAGETITARVRRSIRAYSERSVPGDTAYPGRRRGGLAAGRLCRIATEVAGVAGRPAV